MAQNPNTDKAIRFLASIKQPPTWAQALNVAGEAGEFAEAFRRYSGNARRTGSLEDVAQELADVIISATCMALMLGLHPDGIVSDKWDVIMSRGFGNQTRD
jgi:NTP pyrophosphatase (non-canonical NTP hydrolase)